MIFILVCVFCLPFFNPFVNLHFERRFCSNKPSGAGGHIPLLPVRPAGSHILVSFTKGRHLCTVTSDFRKLNSVFLKKDTFQRVDCNLPQEGTGLS